MSKKLFVFLAAGTALFVGANAYALSVTAAATDDVNAVASGTLGVSGTANAQASGTVGLQINGGLQAQVESGSIATSSDDTIVQLQGNALGLIQTNDDLTAYNNLVVKARPAVKNINVNTDGSMDISYSQPARFLGIFSTSITSNVNVDAQGNVKVSKPWYGFLYAADTTPVQASVTTAIQQSGAPLGTQATATAGATANTQAELQDKAMLVNSITAAIQAEAQASATTTASATY